MAMRGHERHHLHALHLAAAHNIIEG